MHPAKYIVNLCPMDRKLLLYVIQDETLSLRIRQRARILLLSDNNDIHSKAINDIASELGTSTTTIKKVRHDFFFYGLQNTVFSRRKRNKGYGYKVNDELVYEISLIKKSVPAFGYKGWSVRALCEECERKGLVSHISYSTMAKIVKIINSKT